MNLVRRRDHKQFSETQYGLSGNNLAPGNESKIKKSFVANLSMTLITVILVFIFFMILASYYLPLIWLIRILTLLPVAACFWRAVSVDGRTFQQRILPLALVSATVFAQLPSYWGSSFAAICIVMFSLSTLPTTKPTAPQRKKPSILPVLLSFLLLVAIMLTENFMVWVVSATFEAGHTARTAPPPLQDNVKAIIQHLTSRLTKFEVISFRRLWNVQGALVACLGASFVLAEFLEKRQLYSFGRRGVLTLAMARTIRTVSFMATVLPSQNRSCFGQHFPFPPPSDWKEWILVGLTPFKYGGCNDLIISGHATVTSTFACMASSISGDPVFCIALWTMVVLDYIVEIYEGFHYSVDMWFGMVVTCLLWRVLEPIEGSNSMESNQSIEPDEETKSRSAEKAVLPWNAAVLLYSLPALLSFLQLAVLPSSTFFFLLVIYVIIIVVLYFGFALPNGDSPKAALYQHAAVHFMFCVLYMTVGVYL